MTTGQDNSEGNKKTDLWRVTMKTVIQSELEKRERSVHYLHRKIGGNRTNLYEVVKGCARATGPMRGKIAAFLGMQVDELFDGLGMAKK